MGHTQLESEWQISYIMGIKAQIIRVVRHLPKIVMRKCKHKFSESSYCHDLAVRIRFTVSDYWRCNTDRDSVTNCT